MNSQEKNLILCLKKNDGFTLIELLITMVFVSILSLTALPNFLKQVGKARETEMKNAIGVINRSQQAYHWEKTVFAQGVDDRESLNVLLGIQIDNKYIDTYNIIGDQDYATVAPTNPNYTKDGTRAYAGGVFASAGNYSTVICQSQDLDENIPPPTNANTCVDSEMMR